MIRYTLPYPTSLNNIFVNGARGRYKSPAYKAWQDAAYAAILEQGRQRIKGKVAISIAVVKPDKRRRDIDNLTKPVLDALTTMQVIEDDSLVQRISIQWASTGAPCTVLIHEFASEEAA